MTTKNDNLIVTSKENDYQKYHEIGGLFIYGLICKYEPVFILCMYIHYLVTITFDIRYNSLPISNVHKAVNISI